MAAMSFGWTLKMGHTLTFLCVCWTSVCPREIFHTYLKCGYHVTVHEHVECWIGFGWGNLLTFVSWQTIKYVDVTCPTEEYTLQTLADTCKVNSSVGLEISDWHCCTQVFQQMVFNVLEPNMYILKPLKTCFSKFKQSHREHDMEFRHFTNKC